MERGKRSFDKRDQSAGDLMACSGGDEGSIEQRKRNRNSLALTSCLFTSDPGSELKELDGSQILSEPDPR